MNALDRLRQWARRLKADVHALALAARHPEVPWYAKALAVIVAAYAVSPIDLIPDFIPVLGYLDDLVLLPLGIALTIRLIPRPVWEECQRESKVRERSAGAGWVVAGVILVSWTMLLGWVLRLTR